MSAERAHRGDARTITGMANRYHYSGTRSVVVPSLGRTVAPGDVVETEQDLVHPHFALVAPAAPVEVPVVIESIDPEGSDELPQEDQ